MRLTFRNKPEGHTAADSKVIAEPSGIASHFELGRRGEALAVEHLERAGYQNRSGKFQHSHRAQ